MFYVCPCFSGSAHRVSVGTSALQIRKCICPLQSIMDLRFRRVERSMVFSSWFDSGSLMLRKGLDESLLPLSHMEPERNGKRPAMLLEHCQDSGHSKKEKSKHG